MFNWRGVSTKTHSKVIEIAICINNMQSLDSVWFVVAGSFYYAITFGTVRSLGVYFIYFQDFLNANPSEASLAISVGISVMFLSGPLAGFVYNSFGPRLTSVAGAVFSTLGVILSSFASNILVLQLLLGICSGWGLALLNLSVYAMTGRAFSEKRSLANNIISISVNCWSFVAMPLMQLLIDIFGWRGALLLTGAFMANGVPSALLMTGYFEKVVANNLKSIITNSGRNFVAKLNEDQTGSSNSTEDLQTDKKSSYCVTFLNKLVDRSLITDWCFWVFCLAASFLTLCLTLNAIFAIRFAQSVGISDYDSAFYASIIQILAVIFSPISGYITSSKKSKNEVLGSGDRMSRVRAWTLVALLIFYGIAYLIPALSPTRAGVIVHSVLHGIALGLIGGMPYTVLADMFGTERLPSALGIRALLVGVFLISAPPLIGKLVEVFVDFRVVMLAGSLAAFTSAILTAIAQCGLTRIRRET